MLANVDPTKDTNLAGQRSYSFGMALPPDALTKDATEYIGYLVSPKTWLLDIISKILTVGSDAKAPIRQRRTTSTPDGAQSPMVNPAR